MRSALAILLATLVAPPSHAASCPSLQIEAPDVTTLMASRTNPATEGWVVTPKCEVQVIGTVASSNDLSFNIETLSNARAIERVSSVPSELISLTLATHPLSKGIDMSGSRKLKMLALQQSGGRTLRVAFPPSLEVFWAFNGALDTIDNFQFPEGVRELVLQGTGLTSLRNTKLPSSVTTLTLLMNQLTRVDFNLPPKLQEIILSNNPLGKLDGLVIPDTVTSFTCKSCGLTSVQGVRWSSSLRYIDLADNAITGFEIRQTDSYVFKNLEPFEATITATGCKHPKAEGFGGFSGKTLCVLPDAVFDELYPPNKFPDPTPTTLPPDTIGSTGSGSELSSDGKNAASGSTDEELDERGGGSRGRPSNSSTTSTAATESGVPDSGQNSQSPIKSDGSGAANDAASSQNSTLVIVVAVLGSLLVTMIAIIGYRVFAAKRRKLDDASHSKYDQTSTPIDNTIDQDVSIGGDYSSGRGHSSTQEYLANDVRNDKNLLPYRIERGEVQLGKVIARGGFGMVYRGKYDGRDVAIKQMLPDAWRNDTMLASFMDEIRLCASLDHPKIVQFVGITWSSLRDLSVLTEFMTGGDLYDLLYQPANGPRAQDWSQPWSTMTVSNLKCKAQMALDVAEAVVYLHSFASPIIHRDLKSKNVLLDGRGNAKLSDFGISREMVVDETMTSEIGTSAWIAPEVLRGERYSEKADVYSLGVLLVELDRCCHPYEGEPMLAAPQTSLRDGRGGGSSNSVVSKATQIAVLVSTGRLCPSMSPEAPRVVQNLVARCLVNNPEDRMNAMEVFYELRQILRGMKIRAERSDGF